jgi:hypothetical protein
MNCTMEKGGEIHVNTTAIWDFRSHCFKKFKFWMFHQITDAYVKSNMVKLLHTIFKITKKIPFLGDK